MAAKRLSSLFSLPDRSERPNMPRHASSPAASREPSPPEAAQSRSPGPGRLQKAAPTHPRAASGPFLDPGQPSLQDLQQQVSTSKDAGAPVLPLPTFGQNYSRPSSRDGSRPNTSSGSMIGGPGSGSRPGTPTLMLPPGSQPGPGSRPGSPNKTEKRKSSWFGGKSKKSHDEPRGPMAWIAGHPQRAPFDAEGLLNGQKVTELWDDS
jgi:hypothetical protein